MLTNHKIASGVARGDEKERARPMCQCKYNIQEPAVFSGVGGSGRVGVVLGVVADKCRTAPIMRAPPNTPPRDRCTGHGVNRPRGPSTNHTRNTRYPNDGGGRCRRRHPPPPPPPPLRRRSRPSSATTVVIRRNAQHLND